MASYLSPKSTVLPDMYFKNFKESKFDHDSTVTSPTCVSGDGPDQD